MQNFVIVQKSSSVYLAEAMVGTGLPVLLIPGVSCSKESLKASESLCPNGSAVGSFCKSENVVPSLRSLVTAKQLSFSKRAG